MTVRGELDMHTASRLARAISALDLDELDRVVTDLRGLEFMDSCGAISAATRLNELARERQVNVDFVRGRPAIERVFTIAGVSDRLSFIDDFELAAPVS